MQFTARPTTLAMMMIAGSMFYAATPALAQEIVSTDAATHRSKTTLRNARAADLRPSVRYRLAEEPRLVELQPLSEREVMPQATPRGNRVAGKSRRIGWD